MGAGLHAMRDRSGRLRPFVVGLILVLAAAAAVLWSTTPGVTRADGAECDSNAGATSLAVAPDIAPAVRTAVEALESSGGCATFELVETTPDKVINQLVARTDDAPALWVPDSTTWVAQLGSAGIRASVLSNALATSPVVLVGGPAADTPASWQQAMASGRVVMRDPLTSGAGSLALVAPRAERAATKITDDGIRQLLVPLAQKAGAADAATPAAAPLAGVGAATQSLVPTSEHTYLTARRDNQFLTAVVPTTGAPMQSYPLVAAGTASDAAVAAGRELADFFESPSGRDVLESHDLRAAGGAPLPGGVGLGEVEELGEPALAEAATDFRLWQVLSVPSSILAVVDVSGSMDELTADGSRIQLAAGAAQAALSVFPDEARIGLWAFSIDQGGKGVDHRELAPLRPLAAKVGATTQRRLLAQQATRMPGLTKGGTGLYDTTIAAYRQAVAGYDPGYFNSVVLMTDGANDDPGSVRLEDLLTQLRGSLNPGKPVRIIAIGISQDADMAALTKIAQATNGAAYSVRDPRDILDVVGKALLGR